MSYKFNQIFNDIRNETKKEDTHMKIEEKDNTLMKYFIEEKINNTQAAKQSDLSFEKIESFYKKPIKLRNSLKKCYWDRQGINSSIVISIENLFPTVILTTEFLNELQGYIFNDFYDAFIGNLKTSSQHTGDANRILIHKINTEKFDEKIVYINPKLEKFENESKNYLMQILQSKYSNIKKLKSSSSASSLRLNLDPQNSKIIGGLFYFFFKFKKIKLSQSPPEAINPEKNNPHQYLSKNNPQTVNRTEKETEAIKANCYLIFPNVNLEIKRISTLKLSNSSKINKFLVKKLENSNQLNDELLDWGYLGMSLEHRIVALLNNKESRQQIIFGIWVNFPKEPGIKKNISDAALENIIKKHKEEIFQNCLKFLFASEKVNEVDSPSPDENVFLLIVFLSGIPFNFEVKIYPNDVEKPRENEFSNDWLIAKNQTIIENNNLFNSNNLNINSFRNKNEIEFDFKSNMDKVQFKSLSSFINLKIRGRNKSGNNIIQNNVKSLIRNNTVNSKKHNSSSSTKKSNEISQQNESNVNKLSAINSKNFLTTDSNETNLFYQNNNFNYIDQQKELNLYNPPNNINNKNYANEIYSNLNNRIIEKSENYQNYRDKLNDLFERDSNRNGNYPSENYNIEAYKNEMNNNNLVNDANRPKVRSNNDVVFSALNKKSLLNDNENINFNYDYPLKIEKIGRSNSVNKEFPKSKQPLIIESNSELKTSQSASNQYKNIPRGQSLNNYQKNPEKELTYIDSFSKDLKDFADSKTSYNKIDDKKIMNNINNDIKNFNYNTPGNYQIPTNQLTESGTLSVNTNQDSRHDTLKTVSVSHKNSFSREKKSVVDKRGFLEQNISDNNYIQESIMNSSSKHKKFFSMIDGNKSNSLIKNSIQFPNNISNNKNMLKPNNHQVFHSHQFNLQQSNLINESEFDLNQKNFNNLNMPNNRNIQFPDSNLINNFSDANNNLRNAYTIIYDQANSIQILQEKVTKLQTELESVASKLKNQSGEKSLTCSCGNRRSNERQIPLISTGTNTSLDLVQNYNLENSALISNKSTNINGNQKNSKEEILLANKIKSEEDYRYDNLLNDNSINFPKQFLDIDSKQYDSHREDTQNNNTNLNSHHKENSNYKEMSNRRNSQHAENNSFRNLNVNSNFTQNAISNNLQVKDNHNYKKSSTIHSINNNNGNLNATSSINDVTNQDNLNLVSFHNANYDGAPYNLAPILGNYQTNNNIVYSTDFAIKNNELNRIGHNKSREMIDNKNTISNQNLDYLYHHPNYVNNNNFNHNQINYKKEKQTKSNQMNDNVFSTIQNLAEREDDEFSYNIPFNPNNKYQTIDHTSNTIRDKNIIKRSDSEKDFFKHNSNFNNANEKQSNDPIIDNFYFQSKKEINSQNTLAERKNPIPTYIPNTISIPNNNQLANSFITHLEKLNDSSYIAHDLDHKINYDSNERKEEKERNKNEKSKIEIPKTYAINNNLDLTGNDNTSINYDYSQSMDPGTQRLFLKAPSMLCKTNNSISREDTDFAKINRNKIVIDTSTFNHNDKTINIPKIFFDNNETLDSIDENDV